MTKWGGSHSWLFTLGVLKAAGALGLLVGIDVPLIGLAAAVGLVLFFIGAIAVVIRARWYSHLPWRHTYYWVLDLSCYGSQCREDVLSSDNVDFEGGSKFFWGNVETCECQTS